MNYDVAMEMARKIRFSSVIGILLSVASVSSGCTSTNYVGYEQIGFELSQGGVECEEGEGWEAHDWDFEETGVSISSGSCLVARPVHFSDNYEYITAHVFSDSEELDSLVRLAFEVQVQEFAESQSLTVADLEDFDFNPCDAFYISGRGDLVLVGDNWLVTEGTERYSLEIFKGILGGEIMTETELCEMVS